MADAEADVNLVDISIELRWKSLSQNHAETEGLTIYCFSQPKLLVIFHRRQRSYFDEIGGVGQEGQALSVQLGYCYTAVMYMIEQTPH